MNKAFPPVNDAISYLSKVDWNKHMQRIIVVVAFVAAVITVAYEKAQQWYNNGGKEQIVSIYNNFILGSMMVYDYITSKAIPNAKLALNRTTDSLFFTLSEVM